MIIKTLKSIKEDEDFILMPFGKKMKKILP